MKFYNTAPFHDEPKMFHIAVVFNDAEDGLNRAGGSGMTLASAQTRAVGEAIERLSAAADGRPDAVSSYFDLESTAFDPELLALQHRRSPSRADVVSWTRAVTMTANGFAESAFPSQLVYLPHIPETDEPLWIQPTSNGLAAGQNDSHAAWNGLLESLERDALLSGWFEGRIEERFRVDPVKLDDGSEGLYSESLRYGFESTFLRLPSRLDPVTVVACVLEDRRAQHPITSLGLKASHSAIDAMCGALLEAHQLRPWLRELQELGGDRPAHCETLTDRARAFLEIERQAALLAWFEDAEAVQIPEPSVATLGDLLHELLRQDSDVWFAKVGSVDTELSVVRCFCPKLQPVFFTDAFVYCLTSGTEGAPTRDRVLSHPLL